MKKVFFLFAIGQIVLAIVMINVYANLKKATKNASAIEKQLSANCFEVKNTLQKVDVVYTQSSHIIESLSNQLPHIGTGLIETGRTINGFTPGEPGTPIVEVGFEIKKNLSS